MKTAIVILNWNGRKMLEEYLPDVVKFSEDEAEVWVADNASTDDSMELLAERFPTVRTLRNDRNYGFAEGYNKALAQIEADYYVLLNSDVEVDAGWIGPLADWMASHPECGICAPKLLALDRGADGVWHRTARFEYAGAAGGHLDFFGYPYCRGRVLSRVAQDEGQFDSPARVFWASGAALMIRSGLWRTLGGFDDRFFAHMEEIDLCWRAQALGWQVWVIPQSRVYHIGGGTLPSTSPFKLRLNYRNSLWMLKKNLPGAVGGFRAALRIGVRYVLDWCAAAVYLLSGKKPYAQAVVQAHREVRKSRTVPFRGRFRVRPDGGLLLIKYLFRI